MSPKTGNIILLLILVFSFSYRFWLVTLNTFPPGADIGLHESVVQSITSEKTNFFWNYYHMGGGASVTNPGYHIFVAFVIAMTGAPDYLAHSLVSSFFSALIVMCAFLLVRSVWSKSAAFIVAFLVMFSGGDVTILSWSGYPNIITLMLIPAIFYLYIQRRKFSFPVFLSVCSLLVAAMFLTHVFSALVFTSIIAAVLLLTAVSKRRVGLPTVHVISWLLPIILGVALASPYLIGVAPLYFGPEGTATGAIAEVNQTILETRTVSLEVVFWSLIPTLLFFLLSKAYKQKFLTPSAIFFAVWILLPALLTQSHILGIFIDYERFMYFLFLPTIVCVGLLIERGATYFSTKIKRISVQTLQTGKLAYLAFAAVTLAFCILFVPVFSPPNVGYVTSNFYQVMNEPGYDGLQWARTKTSADAILVADGFYGWWLSGFAQRPTLSAVDPQYLTLARELEPARVATNILDSDYYIDNGLIQVKDDGPYASGRDPEFLLRLNDSYVPYSHFRLNESGINVSITRGPLTQHFILAELPMTELQIGNDSERGYLSVTRGNHLFSYTKEISVYKGVRFANVSVTLQSNVDGVSFNSISFPFNTKGVIVQADNTVATLDASMKVIGQIVFNEKQSNINASVQVTSSSLELQYTLVGDSVHVQLFVGLYQYPSYLDRNAPPDSFADIIADMSTKYLDKAADSQISIFNYQASIRENNISYIVVRDATSLPRFRNDPLFNLAFMNSEVSIFEVKNRLITDKKIRP